MDKPPKYFLPLITNGMGLVYGDHMASMIVGWSGRGFAYARLDYPSPDGSMNIITDLFLKSGCEEMIVLDGDLVFSRQDLDFLLSHEVPLVYGIYTKKIVEPITLVLCTFDENKRPFAQDPFAEGVEPLVEVQWVGKGFMRVNRSVFEALKPTTNTYVCEDTGEERWEFWKNMPGGHSEDRYFCNSYRAIGGKILVDQRITARHQGRMNFPVAVKEIAR